MSWWPLVAVIAIWRCDGLAHKWLALRFSVPTEDANAPIVIPPDLEGLALAESELHAQDSVREAIRESYAKYRDWNRVRASLGVATLD